MRTLAFFSPYLVPFTITAGYATGELRLFKVVAWLWLAVAGAFIFSAQNMISRLITADLTPSAYYGAGLRMVYAAVGALLLSFLVETVPVRITRREVCR